MPENIPSLPGALPPKPAESAKVQPKKETVRINLPPKPTAAPTIKLPTLPAGGPRAAASAHAGHAAPPAVSLPASAAPVPAAHTAPKAPPPPPSGASSSHIAGGSPNKPALATAAAPAPAPAPKRPLQPVRTTASISTVDKVLGIIAAVTSLAVAGIVAFLAFYLTNQTGS